MKIAEFFAEIGIQADAKKVQDIQKAILDLPISTAAGIVALAGLEYKLMQVTQEAINAAVGFQMFTAETGQSWQELQKWQIVAAQANVSADAVTSSVVSLEKQIAEIRMGRGNIAPFQLLGIAPTGSGFEVLNQIRNAIRGLDRPTAVNLLGQLGINPEMIKLLDLTDQQFRKFAQTSRGLTDAEYAGFLKAKESLVQFQLVAKQFLTDVSFHLVTDLQFFIEKLRDIPVYMPAVIASVALLAAAFAPVTTAVVGLLLILDDLAAFERGQPSAIGHMMDALGKNKATAAIGDWQAQHLPKWLQTALVSGGNALAGAPAAPRVIQQTNNFSIHGTDPRAIADETHKVLERQVSKSEQEFDNQGR